MGAWCVGSGRSRVAVDFLLEPVPDEAVQPVDIVTDALNIVEPIFLS